MTEQPLPPPKSPPQITRRPGPPPSVTPVDPPLADGPLPNWVWPVIGALSCMVLVLLITLSIVLLSSPDPPAIVHSTPEVKPEQPSPQVATRKAKVQSDFEQMAHLPEVDALDLERTWKGVKYLAPVCWQKKEDTEFRCRQRDSNSEQHTELYLAANGRRIYMSVSRTPPPYLYDAWYDENGRLHGRQREAIDSWQAVTTVYYWHGETVTASEYIMRNSRPAAQQ